MWQTIVVLIVSALTLIYVIRHYVRIFRSDAPTCSCSCSGCSKRPAADLMEKRIDCSEKDT